MTRIEYTTETCTRCHGTGRYSWTRTWQDTCFKCGTKPGIPGSGKQLTKPAKTLLAKIRALRAELCAVSPLDLKPGDKINYHPYGRRTVERVERHPDWPRGWSETNGVRTEHAESVTVHTPNLHIGTTIDGKLERVPTPEIWAQLVAVARKHPKAATIVETPDPELTAS